LQEVGTEAPETNESNGIGTVIGIVETETEMAIERSTGKGVAIETEDAIGIEEEEGVSEVEVYEVAAGVDASNDRVFAPIPQTLPFFLAFLSVDIPLLTSFFHSCCSFL